VIPERFDIGGLTVTVRYDPSLAYEEGSTAEARYRDCEIVLLKSTEASKISDQRVEMAFWHEVVHWVLFMLDKDDLRNDEQFVSQVSCLLHQVVRTSRWGKRGGKETQDAQARQGAGRAPEGQARCQEPARARALAV